MVPHFRLPRVVRHAPVLFALGALLPGCSVVRGAGTTPRPLNILWLIAENIGPDLACYGAGTVRTPALDRLAAEGMRYTRAFATAPVCSTSRSALMTGLHQTAIGAHHHPSHCVPGLDDNFRLPPGVRPFAQRLIAAGYATANIVTLDGRRIGTGKVDLNFDVEGPPLRPASPGPGKGRGARNLANSERLFHTTEWAGLKARPPFHAQVNFPNVERGVQLFNGKWTNHDTNPRHADPATLALPPYYPDTPEVRADWAGYLDSVSGLDAQVDVVLRRLEADGLADDTVVFFFADNGRLEARGLDWCYDSGLHVPLIIRWPRQHPPPAGYRPGAVSGELVSLLDVTATTLALAGLPKPAGLHGRILLGPHAEPAPRWVFGARDRTDEAVQRIRTVRTERYRYIRNFMPEKPFLAPHLYKDAHYPVYRVIREYAATGRLTPAQAALAAPRLPDEELYDLADDAYEVRNLAASADPVHQRALAELRAALDRWIEDTNDKGRVPESDAIVDYWVQDARRTHGKYLGVPEPRPPPPTSRPPR